MDLDLQVVERDPVRQVAVEPVGLLDKENSVRAIAEEGNHLSEGRSLSRRLRGLAFLEPGRNLEAPLSCVRLEKLALSGKREPLFLLPGTDPRVADRRFRHDRESTIDPLGLAS